MKEKYSHNELVTACLNAYPPMIQNEVVSDPLFCRKNHLVTDAKILFLDGTTFQRSELFKTIRLAYLNAESEYNICDDNDNEWQIKEHSEDGVSQISITKKSKVIITNSFWPLIPEVNERILKFEKESNKVKLPKNRKSFWINKLSELDIKDELLAELEGDIENTPIHVFERIKYEMRIPNEKPLSSIIPNNIVYYERLVGKLLKSETILSYSENEFQSHVIRIMGTDDNEALISLLSLCSHFSISEAINTSKIKESRLNEIISNINADGCISAKIGVVEFGLSQIEQFPAIENELDKLVTNLLTNNAIEISTKCELLSHLIKLVDGEISRLQIFRGYPPFYRRLASFAQASMIERAIYTTNISINKFIENIQNKRSFEFYCQSISDLRLESTWFQNYLEPKVFAASILGRLHFSFQSHQSNIKHTNLRKLLSANKDGGLEKMQCIEMFLPGPLSGNLELHNMPPNIPLEIEKDLNVDILDTNSFHSIMNASLFCKVSDKYIEMVINKLHDTKYQVKNFKDRKTMLYLLNGLAKTAAIIRSKDLSIEIYKLTIRYLDFLDANEYPEELLIIGMISSASFIDINEWLDHVGLWVMDIVNLPLTDSGIEQVVRLLNQFIQIEPSLRCTCGRALAILESIS